MTTIRFWHTPILFEPWKFIYILRVPNHPHVRLPITPSRILVLIKKKIFRSCREVTWVDRWRFFKMFFLGFFLRGSILTFRRLLFSKTVRREYVSHISWRVLVFKGRPVVADRKDLQPSLLLSTCWSMLQEGHWIFEDSLSHWHLSRVGGTTLDFRRATGWWE